MPENQSAQQTSPESPAESGNEASSNETQQAAPGSDDAISKLEALVKEKENKYLYLYADFENFKKRAVKERSDLIKFGWENVARELLSVADNLERAIHYIPAGTDEKLVGGLKMVLHQFYTTLEKQGVKKVNSIGQTFDPNIHDAVETVSSNQPAGEILSEHQAGFTLHGRLLRASRVGVSQGPQSTP